MIFLEPGSTTHPAWCSPTDCTAQPIPTPEQYRTLNPSQLGAHQSPQLGTGAGISVRLFKSVAPWDTSEFLTVDDATARTATRFYTAPYTQLDFLLGALVRLLGGIHADACTIDGDHPTHHYSAGPDLSLWCNGGNNSYPHENPE